MTTKELIEVLKDYKKTYSCSFIPYQIEDEVIKEIIRRLERYDQMTSEVKEAK